MLGCVGAFGARARIDFSSPQVSRDKLKWDDLNLKTCEEREKAPRQTQEKRSSETQAHDIAQLRAKVQELERANSALAGATSGHASQGWGEVRRAFMPNSTDMTTHEPMVGQDRIAHASAQACAHGQEGQRLRQVAAGLEATWPLNWACCGELQKVPSHSATSESKHAHAHADACTHTCAHTNSHACNHRRRHSAM